jgi:hypothetical protein
VTIESEINRNTYAGNGASSAYPFTFKITAPADLRVVEKDTDGNETVLALNDHYSVSGGETDAGGTVTLSSPLAEGHILAIRRLLSIIQPTSIANQGPYFAALHENTFDRLTMVDQQQQDEIDRSLRLPESEAGLLELPTKEARASKFLAFDADGEPIGSSGGIDPAIPVSAFGEALAASVNAAAARETLGVITGAEADAKVAVAQDAITALDARTEFISARYFQDTGQSIPYDLWTRVNFGTKVWDTHNAVLTPDTNWRFKVPAGKAGKYWVGALCVLSTAYYHINHVLYIGIRVNSSFVAYGQFGFATGAIIPRPLISSIQTTIDLAVADELDVMVYQWGTTNLGARPLTSDHKMNYVDIYRIGI